MSIIAIMDFNLRTESLEEGGAKLRSVLDQTRAFEGCEHIETLIDSANPARFVAIERWASADALSAYRQWRQTPDGETGISPYLSAPPVGSVLEVDGA